MKITIITVVYNGGKTIGDTIDSVLSQTYPDIEYIVIDGNSTDNSADVIRSYGSRITRFVSEPDKGLYDAINKGLRLATGEVIGLINADDFYKHDQVVEKVVNLFNQTGCDAVYGDIIYVNATNVEKIDRNWKVGEYKEGDFLWGWMPPHPTCFIRRSVYEKLGNYTLELKSSSDYELLLRFIHKYKIKISYLPEVLVAMRSGGMSNATLKHRFRANREDRQAWKINGLRPYFFTLFLKPLRKLNQLLPKL
ncbi:glycosyltransferase family 2 protein [Larkinella terrae]|uniref:Glycosyltransferase n=1 Tax=Larkinella terrae TaxID=2025311 RepID=A0A7K0EVB9_9BACT|nr:glycosyltransferase family 2 protein [Larkinella terrae]MRS65378.1 glycosyltransferase [Larkinella terrae]